MCDLRKSGAYKYSLHPTTQPTCLAFKVSGSPKVNLIGFEGINQPWKKQHESFRLWWIDKIEQGFLFSAHNAFFERCIYRNILVKRYGWPDIPDQLWRCTAAKAAACALPRSLEGAGAALKLSTQKDKMGYVAMMATCKPTRQWNEWKRLQEQVKRGARISEKKKERAKEPEPPVFLEPDANPQIWETLYRYCIIDVKAEEAVDDALPDLIPLEQEIWHLNQRLNWRGLYVDIPTIRKIVEIMARESQTKLKELDALTMGLVTKPGARASILEFLKLEGIELPDIRAKTIEDVLGEGKLSPDMRRLLEIRKALSKTSTKKYQAFIDRAGDDSRVRDILLYHGASTGRDTGTGIQPHNFPRGAIRVDKSRPYAAVENVARYAMEDLQLLYGDSLSIVFSSILRNMIIPTPGFELFVADFSKIEVAVLWWLADNWDGLEVLKSGKDPYKYQAAANTGKRYEDISDEGDERQLGKAQILGAGFRMGWKKFKKAAFDMYRLNLTNRQALDAIKSYRENNAPVVDLWEAFENAMVMATENRGKVYKAGKCKFYREGKFLKVELPSGRKLSYLQPQIVWKTISYVTLELDSKGREVECEKTSKPKKTLQFLGLAQDKKTMRTEFSHGGIMTENIVQAIARDLMMPGMLRLEAEGYQPLLMVHDEGICEKKRGTGLVEEFVKILCEKPKWADEHLPLEAKGWVGLRYKK